MEAERLESYPEAFAKLQANRTYTKKALVRDVFGLIFKDETPTYAVRSDFLRNLFGLELVSSTKVAIYGINALRETETDIFTPTTIAIEIGQAYDKRDEYTWLRSLAKMIARYEVRTRLMLYLLGKGGYHLVFPNGEFFGYRSSSAEILGTEGKVALFSDVDHGFNEMLQTHRWNALGPWWTEEIRAGGLEIAHDFVFAGLRDLKPSTAKLNSRIKISLFLMKYLGILESQASEWLVNPIRATDILGEEIAQDFVKIEFDHSPIRLLHDWQGALQDELGFVVVANLVQRWAEFKSLPISQAESEFDTWMRQQIYDGRVHILDTHAGQPRLGRGLYGDDTTRKIRFEIVEE